MRYFFVYALLIVSTQSFAQWTVQQSPTGSALNSVWFSDGDTGYAAGDNGTIIKTVDGGENWISLTSGTIYDLHSLTFINKLTGFAVGDSGTILKTSDGGQNWTRLNSGTEGYLMSSCFVSPDIGFVAGYWQDSFVLKTKDGGYTWTKSSVFYLPLNSIYFLDSLNGFGVGHTSPPYGPPYGCIYKTTDGGETLSATSSCGQEFPLFSIFFANDSSGYAVGEESILTTSDGGYRWDTLTFSDVLFTSVTFANNEVGFVVGYSGIILKTHDSGKTWYNLQSGTRKALFSVFFTDVSTGYVVGDSGIILKTTNGGSLGWETKKKDRTDFILCQNSSEDKITILNNSGNEVNTTYEIFDAKGILLTQRSCNQKSVEVDVSNLDKGIYFLVIRSEQDREIKKFIKY